VTSWSNTHPEVLLDEAVETGAGFADATQRAIIRPRAWVAPNDWPVVADRGKAPYRRLIVGKTIDWSQYDSVTFMLSISAVIGAPTGWRLRPRLMYAQAHTSGNFFRNPRWYYARAEDIATDVVGGSFFPLLGTDAGSAGTTGTWKRTILRPPSRMAIDLGEAVHPTDPAGYPAYALDAGANPGLSLSLLYHPKGR
jgi:hypothetical protein